MRRSISGFPSSAEARGMGFGTSKAPPQPSAPKPIRHAQDGEPRPGCDANPSRDERVHQEDRLPRHGVALPDVHDNVCRTRPQTLVCACGTPTDRGIGCGATRSVVLKAYGKPSVDEPGPLRFQLKSGFAKFPFRGDVPPAVSVE